MTDSGKLLATAKVHEIAEKKRSEARHAAAEAAARTKHAFHAYVWNHSHPISEFVPAALDELKSIADLIWPPQD